LMCISMRRISITIPDKVAEALERIARTDPSNPSRSRIVSDALVRYIASLYPELLRRPREGPDRSDGS
jgi:metal-responsive CopG/Arc/MetJ family transcriptional regulator